MSLKHLVYRLVHESPAGPAGVADQMGIGKQVLLNKLNTNSTSHHLYIQELETILDFVGANLRLAEYLAQKEGAIVYLLPNISHMDEQALLDAFVLITEKLGNLSKDFRESFSDGQISRKELNTLMSSIFEECQALMTFGATLKRIADDS